MVFKIAVQVEGSELLWGFFFKILAEIKEQILLPWGNMHVRCAHCNGLFYVTMTVGISVNAFPDF